MVLANDFDQNHFRSIWIFPSFKMLPLKRNHSKHFTFLVWNEFMNVCQTNWLPGRSRSKHSRFERKQSELALAFVHLTSHSIILINVGHANECYDFLWTKQQRTGETNPFKWVSIHFFDESFVFYQVLLFIQGRVPIGNNDVFCDYSTKNSLLLKEDILMEMHTETWLAHHHSTSYQLFR